MRKKKKKKSKKNKNNFEKKWYNKEWYKLIKDNLAIILLVPTLTGGIWQVFSLLGLGYEYVRFFSISQLVADGLVMIVLIPIGLIFPIICYHIAKSLRLEILKEKIEPSFSKQLIFLLVSITIQLYLIYYYLEYIESFFENKPSLFIQVIAFVLTIPLIQNCFLVGERVLERIKNYTSVFNEIKTIKVKIWINILNLVRGVLAIIIGLTGAFSSILVVVAFIAIMSSLGNYFVSDNLANIKNIEETMNKSYNLKPEEYSIKYFNDSYIFIEHITVSKEEEKILRQNDKNIPSEIIILKFDNLFRD